MPGRDEEGRLTFQCKALWGSLRSGLQEMKSAKGMSARAMESRRGMKTQATVSRKRWMHSHRLCKGAECTGHGVWKGVNTEAVGV